MTSEQLHVDRARAESFGSVAQQYDRYRPAYPDALVDDLAELRPARVLDIGCGTGKAAVALARRGLPVLGVEPDERMAEVARGRGIAVEVGAFETWDDAGRRFDLLTCGQAWHWIDPGPGIPKAAGVLRPGGTIARFWNHFLLDEAVRAAFDTVYDEHAPHARRGGPKADGEADPLVDSDAFTSFETRVYRWERAMSAGEWVGLVGTFSDHQRLGPELLSALQRQLHATIEDLGGSVHVDGETHLLLARRA